VPPQPAHPGATHTPALLPPLPQPSLVTTKMNPARTFTHEGTVGIGGSYM
jgi:urea carboxylase